MSKNIKYLLLIIIFLIAAFVRFYGITSTPPSLNWDEVALGYNAYSLGIDGKDEFGVFLPYKYLESYGDFKPVVYSYLSIFPIKFFGLNDFAVRFPSAVLGTLTVLLTYFLVKEIFRKKENNTEIEYIALISALIMALSPWHIMLSRGAYEANVSTFFIVLGTYLFLKAINKNAWLLVLSAISFVITFYTFNTPRVFIPLFVIALGIGFRKVLLKNKKQAIVAGIIGFLLLFPTLIFLFSPQAKLRFAEVNIFSDQSIILTSNEYIKNDNDAFWSKVIHNRRVLYGMEFLKHYADNLNPKFLFITGDGNPRFSTQDVGQFYLVELPLLIVGVFLLFRRREGHWWVIPVWFLLGVIPAATARETPHALRIETVIPTLQIIIAYGFVSLLFLMKRYRNVALGAFLILLTINFSYFYHGLMKDYSREFSSEWQYPYKDLVGYVNTVKNNYNEIVVTEALGRPYIYFLFYGKVNPSDFRKNSKIEREAIGFVHVRGFDKYRCVRNVTEEKVEKGKLYINRPDEVPENVKIVKEFKLLNGSTELVAYESF
jgi:4-amino-4-deoxy-L-arabinose transferase-like glycosyltransferase